MRHNNAHADIPAEMSADARKCIAKAFVSSLASFLFCSTSLVDSVSKIIGDRMKVSTLRVSPSKRASSILFKPS
jgi:hypothetical protein